MSKGRHNEWMLMNFILGDKRAYNIPSELSTSELFWDDSAIYLLWDDGSTDLAWDI